MIFAIGDANPRPPIGSSVHGGTEGSNPSPLQQRVEREPDFLSLACELLPTSPSDPRAVTSVGKNSLSTSGLQCRQEPASAAGRRTRNAPAHSRSLSQPIPMDE